MTSFIYHSAVRLVSTTRLSLLGLALASSVVFSQGALAADPSPAASPAKAATETSTAPPHPTIAHHNSFKGTIAAVTPTSLTVTKKKTGDSHTFQLSPETTVSMGQHVQGTLSNLAVGEQVQVQSSPDGSKAIHIRMRKSGENKGGKDCHCESCPGAVKEHSQHREDATSPSAHDKMDHTPANG